MLSPQKAPVRITKPTFSLRKAPHRRHRTLPQLDNPLLPMPEEQAPQGKPPSAHERLWYYYGLPSRTKLVARSSTTPWIDLDDSSVPPVKSIFPASFRHPISSLMESRAVSDEITSALDGIDWVAIDIIRLGYADVTEHSQDLEKRHTLWISVTPDSTSWQRGYDAVMACQSILQRHGIDDVQWHQ
ncbi:unnamed protein product [Clonostachys rosea]|uniref:Uncharacterized protein n=1 Tax=Bionectria ochroleuca TaxID=29856 RepID=A0ABY6UE10_BIOOC|nr:unnamed protein product [Clonostachys rosea]